ncbi:MAG: putative molybdenum carrier protein [Gammaproteobacteria bacterium]
MFPHPEAKVLVSESGSSGYAARTRANAQRYDVTAAFAIDYGSAGERLTRSSAGERWVGVALTLTPIEAARNLFRFLRQRQAQTLNVAGHGLSTLARFGWGQDQVDRWVFEVLKTVHPHWPLKKIGSGGQTGVDLSGVAAGHALGVDVEVHMPRGFVQRLADGRDVVRHPVEIEQEVRRRAAAMLSASG